MANKDANNKLSGKKSITKQNQTSFYVPLSVNFKHTTTFFQLRDFIKQNNFYTKP